MTDRGSQDIIWDAENRPVTVTENGTTAYFWYDGDGNRVAKREGGQTVLYINGYFEVNLDTSTNTSYYYLVGTLVAMSVNSTLQYVHQDHLTGTSVVSDSEGALISSIKYTPYGETRSGDVPTNKLFTGQRLDDTGLYYYGARYYDPTIGRFISPDTIVPDPTNLQSLNRYSYCLNNPLKYTDPSGYKVYINDINVEWLDHYSEYRNLYYAEAGYSLEPYREFEDTLNLPLYNAYDAFREDTAYDPCIARTLEESDRIISIVWGETTYNQGSTFKRDGKNINVVLNENHRLADARILGSRIYAQVPNFVDISAPLLNSTTAYDAISMIPFGKTASMFGKGGKTVGTYSEITKGTFEAGDVISRYQTGQRNGFESAVSGIHTITSFTPLAPITGFGQLIVDANRTQKQFQTDRDNRGGMYRFIP